MVEVEDRTRDLFQRLERLSPERRALLTQRMRATESGGNGSASQSPLRAAEEAAPLSPAQERLWFLAQLDPENTDYQIGMAIRLRGPLRIDAFERTLTEVRRRHSILRTNFKWDESAPVQVVRQPAEFPLPLNDLTELPIEERPFKAKELAERHARIPMNLERDSLFQPVLYRLGDEDHVLAWVIHHLLFDGWSREILLDEIREIYGAFSNGRDHSLSELPLQYADYSQWHRKWVEGERANSQLDYWKRNLADFTVPLDLPAKFGLSAPSRGEGAEINLKFPDASVSALVELARREGATPFVALLAAFQTYLHRVCHQDQIAVGFPVAGRVRSDLEPLIGFFVNTLVLPTDFKGDPTFRDVLRQVRNRVLEALDHQDAPFEKIAQVIRTDGDSASSFPIQAMFQVVNPRDSLPRWAGLLVESIHLDAETSPFDLTMFIQVPSNDEHPDGPCWSCRVNYNAKRFDSDSVRLLMDHYGVLISDAALHPDRPVSELSLMDSKERDIILSQWSGRRSTNEIPLHGLVHELFHEQMSAHPARIAIEVGGRSWTYGELDRLSNDVADLLRQWRVKQGSIVAVSLDRSAELIATMLGILKIGGVYLPLDPSNPISRLVFIIQDAQAAALFAGRESASTLARSIQTEGRQDISSLNISGLRLALASESPSGKSLPAEAACVFYTSGSTGEPKGAVITHRGIVRLVRNTNYVEFDSSDVIAHVSNPSFDASTFEIWGALLHAARLIIVSKDDLLDPSRFARVLRDKGVTTLFLTSAVFNQFARDLPDAFGSLRRLLVGGDIVDPHAVRRILQSGPPAEMINAYGPTENATFTTFYSIKGVSDDATSIPIGRPISGTAVFILDSRLNPVPVGVTGELYIGGEGLALEYLRRPELTAEKFVANPFGGNSESRLYKTGDLARFLPDGNVEFLGRVDNQIKLRGFRVELGEVEARLRRYPEIRDAAVVLRDEDPNDKRLVAYVVPESDAKLDVARLRRRMKEEMPDYMVPASFVTLEKIPLSANGKVNRKSLPLPSRETNGVHAPENYPEGNLQFDLREIWETLLGVHPIGPRDNFFDLGGHSLLVVRLMEELRKTFGVVLPVSAIFGAPTIEQMARLLQKKARSNDHPNLVAIQPKGNKTPLFFAQGGRGSVLMFAHLARCLGEERPIYGVQAEWLDEPNALFGQVEVMAELYIKSIRRVQPTGPYLLGGYCLGGLIAYEMARRLKDKGEEVSLLFMIESFNSNARWRWLRNWAHREARESGFPPDKEIEMFLRWRQRAAFLDRCLAHLPRLTSWNRAMRAVQLFRDHPYRLIQNRIGQIGRDNRPLQPDMQVSGRPPQGIAFRDQYHAVQAYVPQSYSGRVVLFEASQSGGASNSRNGRSAGGWSKLLESDPELNRLDADHRTILNFPAVEILAGKIKEHLERLSES